MTDGITLIPLARIEGSHLGHLVDEFRGLISSTHPADDAGIARLVPDAYPEDPDASAAFAESTQGDLLDRREHDAAIVRAALEDFMTVPDDEDDALTPLDVVIPDADMGAWLRTLSAIRLVIASRLGIETDDDHDPEDPRYGVYDWLGFRLDGLVRAADGDEFAFDDPA